MAELKKLSGQKSITAGDGFRFGLGFWLAWAAVLLVVLPAIGCGTLLALSLLGQFIADLPVLLGL